MIVLGTAAVGFWEIVILLFVLFAFAVPAFVIGKRCNTSAPGIAFVPFVGPMIVLLRTAKISVWWALLILLPYLGTLILAIWLAIVIPEQHRRTRWWTLLLLLPGVNVVGWWVYAFTLQRLESAAGDSRANPETDST